MTTTTCVRSAALAIRRARAARRSGCRLVSGSFRTISAGGLGVKSAAIQSRYRNVPSDNSVVPSGRNSPCWSMVRVNLPSMFLTERRLPGKASSTAASSTSSAPISRMVCMAAARSAPSLPSVGVQVPTWGERTGASASVLKMIVETPVANRLSQCQHFRASLLFVKHGNCPLHEFIHSLVGASLDVLLDQLLQLGLEVDFHNDILPHALSSSDTALLPLWPRADTHEFDPPPTLQ